VPHTGSPTHRPLGVLEAAAVLIASQASAHVALLVAGAPAHPGAGGALALHLALALCAALVAAGLDRALSVALAGLSDALGRLLELLAARPAVRSAVARSLPAPAPAARLPLGRAPPLAA